MSRCDFCGEDFTIITAQFDFELEFSSDNLVYSNFSKCLCRNCAIEAILKNEQGLYFDNCELCGKRFDVLLDFTSFSKIPLLPEGIELKDFWESSIVCCNCAREMMENDFDYYVIIGDH